jgi:hypothetical protein
MELSEAIKLVVSLEVNVSSKSMTKRTEEFI